MSLGAARVFGSLSADSTLDLPSLPVGQNRNLQLVATGAAGQVLGLAVQRDVPLAYGERRDVLFSLRRPLFFFGGGPQLTWTPSMPPSSGLRLALQTPLAPDLRDETVVTSPPQWLPRLSTMDPNAGLPLLPQQKDGKPVARYTRALPLTPPVVAAAGSSDGLSLLAVAPQQNPQFHVIDTGNLSLQGSYPLPGNLAAPRAVVVGPADQWAAVLHYDLPAPKQGRVAQIVLVRNLKALRARTATALDTVLIDLTSTAQQPLGVPLSATPSPTGTLDVVFGQNPLESGQPDCAVLGANKPAVLRHYDPQTGLAKGADEALPYTTSLVYTQAGERILVQPCAKLDPNAAAVRPGLVVFEHSTENVVKLAAPGTLTVAAVGNPAALVAVGRDGSPSGNEETQTALGAVRILEPGRRDWSTTSTFNVPFWSIPYRVTTTQDGTPIPDVVSISMGPRDVSAYQVVVTPDRARALVALRVGYDVQEFYIVSLASGDCFLRWNGYGYAVALVNLQTGAREQYWTLGQQNIRCDSTLYNSQGNQVGTGCFSACSSFLRGYQEGYVPSGISAIFGGR